MQQNERNLIQKNLTFVLQHEIMANEKLGKKTSDKVSFIIPEFAAALPEAYCYLVRYGGFEFLTKHWWALHTDNKYWTLLDIYDVCRKNGGYLR